MTFVGIVILAQSLKLLAAMIVPSVFTYILGAKYTGLDAELPWVVATGCAAQLSWVLWTLNSSKAWISVYSFSYIPVIIGAQCLLAFTLDMSSFHGVLIFNFWCSIVTLPVYAIDGVLGLIHAKN